MNRVVKEEDEDLDIFRWSGKNDYIALGEPEYIAIGGGFVIFLPCRPKPWLIYYHLSLCDRDGSYGLYLDETLFDGSSARCPTFENEPLCDMSGARRGHAVLFECVGLEVWAIGG